MNPQRISHLLGVVIGVLAATMTSGIAIALLYGDDKSFKAFSAAVAVTAAVSAAFYFYGRSDPSRYDDRPGSQDLHPREAIVVVCFSWIIVCVLGGLPYMFDGTFQSYDDAFYESVAGFTTTGSTVLVEIEHSLSQAGHFWRCLTHWLGGMGIVMLFVAIFPQLGVGGKHLFKSEVPGPITEGLRPKIKETSTALWKIYMILTLLNFGLLIFPGGMNWFDAICHAFSTLGTGGFSTENASVGQYRSVPIDVITTLFMLLAGVNFSLYYLALIQGHTKRALRDRELWTYAGIVVFSTLAISLSLWLNADALNARPEHPEGVDYNNFFQSLRYGAFQVAAIITTTGFGTDNFDQWSPFSKLLLVFIMFMGGCAGSTAGGIKVFRVLVIFKAAILEAYHSFRPKAVKALRVGTTIIPHETVHNIVVFFAVFIFIFVAATLFVAAFGHDIVTSATATVACLASIGPGLGKVNGASNFAFFEPPVKIVLSFCMILGRLELFTLLVLLMPSFWRR